MSGRAVRALLVAGLMVVATFVLTWIPAAAAPATGVVTTSGVATMVDDEGQGVPAATINTIVHASVVASKQLVLTVPVGSQANRAIVFILSAQSDPGFVTVKDGLNNAFTDEGSSGGAPTHCNPASCSTTFLDVFSRTGPATGSLTLNATWTKNADASGVAVSLYNVAQDIPLRSSFGFRFLHNEAFGNTGTAASSNTVGTGFGVFAVLQTEDLALDAIRVNATPVQNAGQILQSTEGNLRVSSKVLSPAGLANMGWTWTPSTLYNYIAVDIRPAPAPGICPPWVAESLNACQGAGYDSYGSNGTTQGIFMGTNKAIVRRFDNPLIAGTVNVGVAFGVQYQPWDSDYPARAQSSGVNVGTLSSTGDSIGSTFMRMFVGDSMTASQGSLYCGTNFFSLPTGIYEGNWVIRVTFVSTRSWTCSVEKPDGTVVFQPVASSSCTPNPPFVFCSVQDINGVALEAGPEISWTIYDYVRVYDASAGAGSSPPPPPLRNVITFPNIVNLNCAQVEFTDPRGAAAVASTILWVYNFGDGSPLNYSPVPTVRHTYARNGVYPATMTTQDKQGNVQAFAVTVDTTTAACGVVAFRALGTPLLAALFVALLVASFVIPKKSKLGKYRTNLRRAAAGSFAIAIVLVVIL